MCPKLMDWEGDRVPKINEIWMLACMKNSMKNWWFGKPKLKKIVKKTLPKTIYFLHAFFYRFWRGLGRVLGRFWEGFGRVLASPGPLFYGFFGCLYLECSPKGVFQSPGLDFGSIFKGLGRVWEGIGEVLGRFWEGRLPNSSVFGK